jgi:hypothetical protein
VAVKSLSLSMPANRLSIVVFMCFLDGSRNRGSVWKLANLSSAIRACGAAPFFFLSFRLSILAVLAFCIVKLLLCAVIVALVMLSQLFLELKLFGRDLVISLSLFGPINLR